MRAPIPAPPYAPYADFRAPSILLPVVAAGLAAASFGLWSGSSRGDGPSARKVAALAAGGAAIFLLERWLSRRGRPAPRPAEQDATAPPDRHMEQLLDEAVEETFPASDPIAVHIE